MGEGRKQIAGHPESSMLDVAANLRDHLAPEFNLGHRSLSLTLPCFSLLHYRFGFTPIASLEKLGS